MGDRQTIRKKLLALRIKIAQQFAELNDEFVRKEFSVVGLRLKRDLSGLITLSLEDTPVKKNITVTRAFERMYEDYDELKERVSYLCCQNWRKAQEAGK